MAAGRKIEIELKYEVEAVGSADRYLVAPEIGPFKPTGQVSSVQLEDRYVDSGDWALARAGFAARLRHTSRGTTTTASSTTTRPFSRGKIRSALLDVPGSWPVQGPT